MSSTFEQLFRDSGDSHDDDENVGLKDVVDSLHSKFQSNFVKLLEPLSVVKKMGEDYRATLAARLDDIKDGYRSLLQAQAPPSAVPSSEAAENILGTI